MVPICTFQFKTQKIYEKVAWELLGTHYHFSVYYGQLHYGKPRCITVWGKAAIENVREECRRARISYVEYVS